MKHLKTIIWGLALGAALGASAFAQPAGHDDRGPRGHFAPPHAAGLSTNYAALAPYDANKDGQLDDTEQAAVAQALVDGKLQPPGRPPGRDGQIPPAPNVEMAARIAKQMAAWFAVIAPYDVNKDGQLDTAEQAAVTAALADGTLKLPRPSGPRGGRHGDPAGGGGETPQ